MELGTKTHDTEVLYWHEDACYGGVGMVALAMAKLVIEASSTNELSKEILGTLDGTHKNVADPTLK